MSRVYWDTMLFIYLLEDHEEFAPRIRRLLERAYSRGDSLYTSCLGLGEVLAGADNSASSKKALDLRETIVEMGFSFLPFNEGAVQPFVKLRMKRKLKVADSIHLACAASAGIDLFLTCDRQLAKLDIPGIQFIAEFSNEIL